MNDSNKETAMGYREIVVHIDDAEGAQARVQQALRLARQHEAHLVGQYVIDMPSVVGYTTAEMPAELFTMQREAFYARAAKAKAWFDEVTGESNSPAEWRQDEGVTVDRLCISARRADLLLMGLAPGADASSDHRRDTIASTMLSAGVPVMVVPDEAAALVPGKFVTVGWNGGREATRAVHDALPILQRAEMVSIACVDPTGGVWAPNGDWAPHGDVPGADIAHWLARQGVTAEAQSVASAGKSKGDTLLDWARGQGSDLLVVGGYGHSRMRELLLDGVTRHLLRNTTIPLLMSH